jgi:hypothetical protein
VVYHFIVPLYFLVLPSCSSDPEPPPPFKNQYFNDSLKHWKQDTVSWKWSDSTAIYTGYLSPLLYQSDFPNGIYDLVVFVKNDTGVIEPDQLKVNARLQVNNVQEYLVQGSSIINLRVQVDAEIIGLRIKALEEKVNVRIEEVSVIDFTRL